MKIAIVGGTGALGMGLATLLSKKYEVYIGSRDRGRAVASAKSAGVKGGESHAMAELCDAAILAIPFGAVESLASFERQLAGKLVISPVVPLRSEGGTFYYDEAQGSAAQMVAAALKRSRVAAALHTVPVRFLKHPEKLDVDVLVAADDRKTFHEAAAIVGSVGRLRPLYGGSLAVASSIERLTPLLLNLATLNGFKTPSVKFVD